MTNKYDVEMPIYPSRTDAEARLGIPDCFALFMDIAAPHAAMLGCGTQDLAKKDLFWITAKSKIKILRRPYMMEEVTVSTWPRTPQESRCYRDYSITKGDEVLVLGTTLWAVVNTKTGKLHRVDELYPEGFVAYPEIAVEESFAKFTDDFTAEPFANYKVRSADIDFGGHMNNIAYIRAIEGAFSVKEWKEMNIKEMEIYYKAQCFEGDILEFVKKEVEGGIHICVKVSGKPVLYAAIGF